MTVINFIKKTLGLNVASASPYNDWLQAEIDAVGKAETAEILNTYLMHRNGFVREAALRRAQKLLMAKTLPAVIIRLNDWVPQVRVAAKITFQAFFDADRFDDVMQALPEIYALRQRGRDDHTATVEMVEHWVASHAQKEKLVPAIAKAPPPLARCCFDIAWKYKLQDNVSLLHLGLKSRDIVTTKQACGLITALPEQQQKEFIDILLQSNNGWFRFAALQMLDETEAPKYVRNYLLDNYSRLREWCEKRLALPDDELWRLRRAALTPDSPAVQALVAIRLCGSAKDAASKPLIIPFLQHAKADLRGAALLALSRISPDEYETDVKAALTDPAAAIGRAAVQAARDAHYAVSPAEWEDMLGRATTTQTFRRLLSLARSRSKWEHLGFALALTRHEKFSAMAAPELAAWRNMFNRSSIAVKPEQREWIAKNLAAYSGRSPSKTEIEFYLR